MRKAFFTERRLLPSDRFFTAPAFRRKKQLRKIFSESHTGFSLYTDFLVYRFSSIRTRKSFCEHRNGTEKSREKGSLQVQSVGFDEVFGIRLAAQGQIGFGITAMAEDSHPFGEDLEVIQRNFPFLLAVAGDFSFLLQFAQKEMDYIFHRRIYFFFIFPF